MTKAKIYSPKTGKFNNEGRKDDSGKLRMDLIPPSVLEELALVLSYGANKYGDNNWQGVDSERYIAALLRHYCEWRKGNDRDSESNIRHLSHMLANVAFLLWKELNNEAT